MIWPVFFLFSVIFLLLALLAYTDLRYYILPNIYNGLLALAFLIFHGYFHFQTLSLSSLFMASLGAALLLLFIRWLASRLTQQDALGLGDVKLMTASGLGLGLPDIFLALSLGSLLGLAHGFLIYLYGKRKNHLQNTENAPAPQETKLSHVNVPAGVGLSIAVFIIFLYRFGPLCLS